MTCFGMFKHLFINYVHINGNVNEEKGNKRMSVRVKQFNLPFAQRYDVIKYMRQNNIIKTLCECSFIKLENGFLFPGKQNFIQFYCDTTWCYPNKLKL